MRYTGENKSIAIIGGDDGNEYAVFDAAVIAGLSWQLRVSFDVTQGEYPADGPCAGQTWAVVSNVASLGRWAMSYKQRHHLAMYEDDGLSPSQEFTTA